MFNRSLLLCICIASASAFTPIATPATRVHSRNDGALNATPNVGDVLRKTFASFAAGAVILSNVAIAPAAAFDNNDLDFGSSQVLAARSGGRAGGRSSYKAPPAMRSSAPQKAASPTIIRETRIITPAYSGGGAYMAAPMYAAPQPGFPGLGVVAGLGAMNAIGDNIREYRQEGEIRDARQQVNEARIKQAELEARLNAMERQSSSSSTTMYAPPPPGYGYAPLPSAGVAP